jgi:acetyl-CoA carboxylase biotin carboxylase subunit
LVPGSAGEVQTEDEAAEIAAQIGYPVMLKAAAGGGGKGMRVAKNEEEARRFFALTSAEAVASFGNGSLFLERFLGRPRHIEIQVAGDGKGNALHFAERDCSIQRRHQKLVEEAPAVGLPEKLRQDIRQAATNLVADTNYLSVGTVEFLVEGDEFFFLEVNPRIQVEHPVTEAVTNVDLVQLQIDLAAGKGLPFAQDELHVEGHAIELRINAEHPRTFMPSPGRITGFHLPGGPGVRIDSAVHEQAMVQPYYDSLVAKLIVRAQDRPSAIRRAQRALSECVVEGIHTCLPLHRDLLASDEFKNLEFHTRFLEGWLEARDEES